LSTCVSRIRAQEQHVTVPAHTIEAGFFDTARCSTVIDCRLEGHQRSDMVLMPIASTAVLDPFFEETTLIIRCDVLEPATMQGMTATRARLQACGLT